MQRVAEELTTEACRRNGSAEAVGVTAYPWTSPSGTTRTWPGLTTS